MDAAAGQTVQRRGQRRRLRLALAGPHLGDPALVEDDAANELDVEVAHLEGPPHRFAGRREDLGQGLVHGCLQPIVLALAASLGQFAAALQLRVMAFVVGRLFGFAGIADLVAQLVDEGAEFGVGARLHLRFQRVGPVDQGLDAVELAVVRVDEAAQEAKH